MAAPRGVAENVLHETAVVEAEVLAYAVLKGLGFFDGWQRQPRDRQKSGRVRKKACENRLDMLSFS
jgi:hypothetical protein